MTEWQELMRLPERQLSVGGTITFGSGETYPLDGSRVVRLTVSEGADDALLPGAVLSAVCTLDLRNDDGEWTEDEVSLVSQAPIGATLSPELIALDGNDSYSALLGVFQIESAAVLEQEAIVRLRASDSISFELSADFADTLTYPATLAQVWAHAVAQTRYVWNGSVPNGNAVIDSRPDWKHISLRRALSFIAAAAGCFVRVTRDGSLELCRVWTPNAAAVSIGADDYLKLERDGASFGPVDSLKVTPVGRDANGDPAAQTTHYADANHTELYSLTMEENPLFAYGAAHLNALAAGTLAQIAGLRGESARFTWRGDPTLEIGAVVALTDRGGNTARGILSRQTLTLGRGFSASCVCAIPESNDAGVMRVFTPEGGLNAAALAGTVDGGLISAHSITAEKIAAGSITAEKIAAGAVDAGALSAITAKIQSLTAADIATDRLAAALAGFCVIVCGTASFDEATIRHLVAAAMNITDSGVAGKMFIENLAVKYAQIVSATIGSLCVKASDGNYYRIDVSDSGCVTATRVTLTNSEITSGITEGGREIVETSLTAASLNTANLQATYALINRIDAARLDVDELFARDAFVSRLTTNLIVGDKSITMLAGELDGARALAEALQRDFVRVVNIDADGLHVGDNTSVGEVLIDSESVNVVLNGQRYSKFAASYVQFGNYQLRKSADGGLVFKLKEA